MLDKFALSSKKLHGLLLEKDVKFLFHANTVATSRTLIQEGCLLSRHEVALKEGFQTKQFTDDKDVIHDVWDSVFVDGTDHHRKYNKPNTYGPVLFRFSLDLLLTDEFDKIYITRDNPSRWTSQMTLEDKYYDNLEDVKKDYLTGIKNDSQIMFTFRNIRNSLKFNKYLHSIGLDAPNIMIKTKQGEIYTETYIKAAIEKELIRNGLEKIPIIIRHRSVWVNCNCHFIYRSMHNHNFPEFLKRFGIQKSKDN